MARAGRTVSQAATLLLMLLVATMFGCAHGRNIDPSTICAAEALDHVNYLASPELEGRGVGTEGLRKAAHYIAQQFALLGLKPAGQNGGYLQPLFVPSLAEGKRMTIVWNVVGYLPPHAAQVSPAVSAGQDTANEAVVIGAHYDHLGYGKPAAWNVHGCAGAHAGLLYPGADDNASGVSAMLTVAKAFAKDEVPRKRGVLFVAFAAEEMGLLGSRHFVDHLPPPITDVVAMLNFDMVGRLRPEQGITIEGANTWAGWWPLLASSNKDGLKLRGVETLVEDSDHAPFFRKDRPVLFFFTGMHGDYHCYSDTPDLVSGEGIAKVATLAYRVAHQITMAPERHAGLSFVRIKVASRTSGFGGPRLGLMPDYAASGGLGVFSVLPGGPAEAAGIEAGDTIVRIGKHPVGNIEDYMAALAKLTHGETVEVEVKRGAGRRVLPVTLNRPAAPALHPPAPAPPPAPPGTPEAPSPGPGNGPGNGTSGADQPSDRQPAPPHQPQAP